MTPLRGIQEGSPRRGRAEAANTRAKGDGVRGGSSARVGITPPPQPPPSPTNPRSSLHLVWGRAAAGHINMLYGLRRACCPTVSPARTLGRTGGRDLGGSLRCRQPGEQLGGPLPRSGMCHPLTGSLKNKLPVGGGGNGVGGAGI